MVNQNDVLKRVFAHIKQLVDSPLDGCAYMDDVDRYNDLLDKLEAAGFDMSDFRFDLQRDMYMSFYNTIEMRADIFNRQVKALAYYFEVEDKIVRYSGSTPASNQ